MPENPVRSTPSTSKNRLAATACLIAASLVISSQLAPFEQHAALMWGLALISLATGFWLARQSDTHSRSRSNRSVLVAVAAFTIGAVVATTTTYYSADNSPEFSETLAEQADSVASSRTGEVSLVEVDLAASEPAATEFATTQAKFEAVDDDVADDFAARARDLEYDPASGLEQDFSRATVEMMGGHTVVTVPLKGTNLPEMTKVSYMSVNGTVHVTEMVAEVINKTHASFQIWQDGTQSKDVLLYDPAASASDAMQVGLNWSTLNECLANAGINNMILAMIGVACAAACATAVGCAPCIAAAAGFGSGTIAACVNYAWE